VETRKQTVQSTVRRKWRNTVQPRYAAIHLSRSNEVKYVSTQSYRNAVA